MQQHAAFHLYTTRSVPQSADLTDIALTSFRCTVDHKGPCLRTPIPKKLPQHVQAHSVRGLHSDQVA